MGSAITFPGMGTQDTGMGREVYDRSETFRTQFDRLDDGTAIDLEELCFERSAADLSKPRNAEPAIVAVSYSFAKMAAANGYTPDYVGGLSLGTFTALAFAGAIEPDRMVSLARRRGELIEEYGDDNGTMTAVVTDDVERVDELIGSYDALSIGVRTTENSCVVGGDADELESLLDTLDETAPFLERHPVDGVDHGFHSPLLEPVVPEFEAVCSEYEFHDDFRYPVVSDTDGTVRTDSDGIRDELTSSLVEPVRIDQVLDTMATVGVDTYIEMLPEGRLSTAIAHTDPEATIVEPTALY